ncbi:MAG: alpha-D-ribose 1-methylphosphonate 5-triphosphate diphosphatase [Planctomycetota bacterium]
MTSQYLTRCRVILPDHVIEDGAIRLEGDRISAICPEAANADVEVDLGGAYLMPGMIDLHSDAIESLAEPRSGIYLPFDLAARQADQLAACHGITTLYNAISFAGEELGLRSGDAPSRLAEAVTAHAANAVTDQRVHCRYEVTVEESLNKILRFIENGSCDLVSYMDHSPGQGQFQDEANYRSYMTARYGYSDEMISELLDAKSTTRSDGDGIRRRVERLSAAAAECSVPLAGHDSDSSRHVDEMISLGASLAEFPMTEEAAAAAVAAGLHQSVGSVNVIRGGSQRTGMSALALIGSRQADCLCSDYVPATLLPAVLKICNETELSLSESVGVVTLNPARAVGLTDRGQIRVGYRADLVAFEVCHLQRSLPTTIATWCGGRLAYYRSAIGSTATVLQP